MIIIVTGYIINVTIAYPHHSSLRIHLMPGAPSPSLRWPEIWYTSSNDVKLPQMVSQWDGFVLGLPPYPLCQSPSTWSKCKIRINQGMINPLLDQ